MSAASALTAARPLSPGATAWYSKPWWAQQSNAASKSGAYHGLEYQAVAPKPVTSRPFTSKAGRVAQSIAMM
jgi:hypothetical protein